MGLRFRKILPLAKRLKLNLSKSGASVSAGRKGAIFNFGLKGVKATIGAPGTGLGYQTTTPYGKLRGVFIAVAIIVVVLLILN